jgi:hypothetical protein
MDSRFKVFIRPSGVNGLPFSIPMDASRPSVSGFNAAFGSPLCDMIHLVKEREIIRVDSIKNFSTAGVGSVYQKAAPEKHITG